MAQINNKPALVQVMAWHRKGGLYPNHWKSSLLTHIYASLGLHELNHWSFGNVTVNLTKVFCAFPEHLYKINSLMPSAFMTWLSLSPCLYYTKYYLITYAFHCTCFKLILCVGISNTYCKVARMWMPRNPMDDNPILSWVMAGCCQVTSYMYITQIHFSDVIMSAVVTQITGVSIVCPVVCSGANQRKHQSSVSLAFVRGIHRWHPLAKGQ